MLSQVLLIGQTIFILVSFLLFFQVIFLVIAEVLNYLFLGFEVVGHGNLGVLNSGSARFFVRLSQRGRVLSLLLIISNIRQIQQWIVNFVGLLAMVFYQWDFNTLMALIGIRMVKLDQLNLFLQLFCILFNIFSARTAAPFSLLLLIVFKTVLNVITFYIYSKVQYKQSK